MFTGIVKEIGVVEGVGRGPGASRLSVKAPILSGDASTGDSISVDGVCLTVVAVSGNTLKFDAIEKTLHDTTLRFLKRSDKVNLEPSLVPGGGKLSGHLVSGHVDEVGVIKAVTGKGGGGVRLTVELGRKNLHLLVDKGSVALDGISLTVNDLSRGGFSVDIVPHTLKATTLGFKKAGDKVNVEFDMIGKYAHKRNTPAGREGAIDEGFLKEHGFL